MTCFRCNATENFIFSLKYRQRNVDLNTSKKSLVFVTIQHSNFHLYVLESCTKISYLCKNTHLQKDAAFLHFRLKESSENMIFPWNVNIPKLKKIWSFLPFSKTFLRQKLFFSCRVLWDFSMIYQIFLSPQVKRWMIITYKHGIHELPHELPNNFRL